MGGYGRLWEAPPKTFYILLFIIETLGEASHVYIHIHINIYRYIYSSALQGTERERKNMRTRERVRTLERAREPRSARERAGVLEQVQASKQFVPLLLPRCLYLSPSCKNKNLTLSPPLLLTLSLAPSLPPSLSLSRSLTRSLLPSPSHA